MECCPKNPSRARNTFKTEEVLGHPEAKLSESPRISALRSTKFDSSGVLDFPPV